LKVIELAAMDTLTSIVNFELPAPKAGCKMVAADNVPELIRLLHEEAKAF
jgi:electron transfer flavoprotein beta subunit